MTDLYRVANEEILCVDKFIGDESCAELCMRLSKKESTSLNDNSTVKRLVLRGNCLSTRSAQSLGNMLRGNHTLEMLSLEWNQLGSSGASFIAHAMETNTHLEQVDLRNNGIGDEGAMAFAQSLVCNDSLRVLDLRWNQIGDEGAKSFENVLQQRKTQLTIILTGNLVSQKVLELMEKWSQAYRHHAEEEPVEEEKLPIPVQVQVDTYEARYKEILKEHTHLKHQHATVMTQNADMRRQLDTSAITVTDLEQKLLREEFQSSQWEEQLRVARQRISEMTNEYLVASHAWDSQRVELAEDHKRALADMTTEIKGHIGDKESLKERLRKAKESLDNLEVHSERLQRQAKEEIVDLQEELRRMTDKASESALQESKATTEAHIAGAALARATDRLAILEAEMETAKEQTQLRLEAEQKAYQEEIDQLRQRITDNIQESSDKIGQLTDEMSHLRTGLAEAESEIASLKIQMQQSCDEAASLAQKEERARSDQILQNLQIRIETLSNEKHDLDSKYLSLAEEMKGVRQSHNTELRGLQDSLTERRHECETLRQDVLGLTSKASQLEADNHTAAAEIDLLRTKVADIDGRECQLQDELRRVSRERDALLGTVQTLEKEARQEAQRQQEDFGDLSQRLTALVARELDAARPKFVAGGKHNAVE